MKILVDAMGGDHAPQAPVEASVRAAKELDVHIVLIGDENIVRRELGKYGDYPKDKITVIHAPEMISNHEEPAKAVRKKKGRIRRCGGTDA